MKQLREPLRHVAQDCYAGFLLCTQNSLALVGLSAVCVLALVLTQPKFGQGLFRLVGLNAQAAPAAMPGTLQESAIEQFAGGAKTMATQTTALLGLNADDAAADQPAPMIAKVDAPELSGGERSIARYLSNKYRVNSTAIELLVGAAHLTGRQSGLEPSLLLAVMAIESRFNPFADSGVGAQGLMQVMARVHADKLDDFGGARAALNPVVNLQVGAVILKDCIQRAGSVAGGLRLYVGAGVNDDDGYGAKVLQEKDRIDAAARAGTPRNAKPARGGPAIVKAIAAPPRKPEAAADRQARSTDPKSATRIAAT